MNAIKTPRTLRLLATSLALGASAASLAAETAHRSPGEIVKTAKAEEWRALDPQNTVVMRVNGGQVVFELAPRFAPLHAANIRTLAHEGYFEGTAILRVHDNYVTQWGDPNEDDKAKAKSFGSAKTALPAEFAIAAKNLPVTPVAGPDGWAPETGFIDAMPVALDRREDQAWIPHCYGVIGVARGATVDSGSGAGLYVVIGQSPRALDRNITIAGRVLQGMEYLTALPRGTGQLGFYEKPEQFVPITGAKLLADLPPAQRPQLEVLKTDSASFKEILESRRHVTNPWFVHSPEYVNVCNIQVPVRPTPKPGA